MSEEYLGAFGPQAERRAPCPTCGRETRVDTLFERIDRWHEDGPDISFKREHYVFQCRGCEFVFLALVTGNSEDYAHVEDVVTGGFETVYIDRKSFLPATPSVPLPSWAGFDLTLADETLSDLHRSIYTALNNDLRVLAAIGIRTAFDRASELMKIKTSFSFARKLREMEQKGLVSGIQRESLEVLIDAGSAAAHRGWKPSRTDLMTLLEILEGVIRDHFLLRKKVARMKQSIPERPS